MANSYKYETEDVLRLLPQRRTAGMFSDEMETFAPVAPVADHSGRGEGKPASGGTAKPVVIQPGDGDQTTDLVRIYLKDMGSYLLLSREEEIALAKKIEKGEKAINKALARTPAVLDELVVLEMHIRKSPELVNRFFSLGDEELTPESIEQKKLEILEAMKRIKTLSTRLSKIRPKASTRFARARLVVRMIHLAQGTDIRSDARDRIIEKIRKTLKSVADKGSPRLRAEARGILSSLNRGFRTRGAFFRRSTADSAPGTGPKRSSFRPISGSSYPSPRNIRTGASNFWTLSRKATSG